MTLILYASRSKGDQRVKKGSQFVIWTLMYSISHSVTVNKESNYFNTSNKEMCKKKMTYLICPPESTDKCIISLLNVLLTSYVGHSMHIFLEN